MLSKGYADLLEDGELPICGMRLMQYIDEDGKVKYRFRWAGDAAITEVIGLLELVKAHMLTKALKEEDID